MRINPGINTTNTCQGLALLFFTCEQMSRVTGKWADVFPGQRLRSVEEWRSGPGGWWTDQGTDVVSTLVAEGEQGSLSFSILACENIRFSSGYLYSDKPESKNTKRERDDRKKKLASSNWVTIISPTQLHYYMMALRSECGGKILRKEKVNSLLASLLLHLKIHRGKGLERVTLWTGGLWPNFSIFKGKTLFGKNKTKHSLNVDCRLIYFIQFNTFFISNVSLPAFSLRILLLF